MGEHCFQAALVVGLFHDRQCIPAIKRDRLVADELPVEWVLLLVMHHDGQPLPGLPGHEFVPLVRLNRTQFYLRRRELESLEAQYGFESAESAGHESGAFVTPDLVDGKFGVSENDNSCVHSHRFELIIGLFGATLG